MEPSTWEGRSDDENARSFCELLALRMMGESGVDRDDWRSREDVGVGRKGTVLISEDDEDAEALGITWGRPSPRDA